ncbi:hypothetical protein FIBSPDRAFT_1040042 [Athelia psychrophila]|uniref:Uncharacterized protein n=1 Tax=Athelia psychrophila TaxID=1759441 RepID=A0A166R1W3_9AGAM|nr:hypothetical protein FIBSPDRAFT_1040042 [Fibularhizoctonia sp. CBS 109695]
MNIWNHRGPPPLLTALPCTDVKRGSLGKFAGCDHTINCMVVFPLTHTELASPSYTNTSAADSHVDMLPAKSRSSWSTTKPVKHSIGKTLLAELNSGMEERARGGARHWVYC